MSILGATMVLMFAVLATASIGGIELPRTVVGAISIIGALVGYALVILDKKYSIEGVGHGNNS